jgi:predicted aconitase
VDVLVPAESEFVLEGTVYLDRTHPEGPFVDLTETYDVVRQEPVFVVKTITHRADAIWHALLPGALEHKLLMGMPREPTIFRKVNEVVRCLDVNINPGGCSWLHAIVQIDKQHEDDGKRAIQAAFEGHRSCKHVYVVDADIDIYNPQQVEWAMATRFQGDRPDDSGALRPAPAWTPAARPAPQHHPGGLRPDPPARDQRQIFRAENWEQMGISPEFARQQRRVIDAFARMDVKTTCSCTPYLIGNRPHAGDHIAWAESSAVCYANSVLGARTNREGGPSALAAALTGFTPAYGLHLDENRRPTITIQVEAHPDGTAEFGALGKVIGEHLELRGERLPYILGIKQASLEALKAFCASLATYGGSAMFYMPGITPEAALLPAPEEKILVTAEEVANTLNTMSDATSGEVDFVSLGCPHLSIEEVARIAEQLRGRKVKKTFWITTARPTRQLADQLGYTQIIEESGAIFATDTCCVVAPIRGRFHALATDSAKACYYASAKNKFKTLVLPFDEVIEEALK